MINNLFDYATSELSQDAVISWLSKWGDDEYKSPHPILNQLGKEFIKLLLDNEIIKIETVEIHRQYNHIDVVLVINKGEYIICVEDKVDSGINSNQLYRYKNNITKKKQIIIDD
ncbi:PD-(D/E)XK nuclease family protein [Halanaerobium congolense]|uniref:PD-(D/E)XK nuclease family protein n=1 Tax=Halanaerobium congolense TaxID=54121 RepID=UPI000B7D1017|nr:PD-(D/E)XK nuclease family protein [Halanaerobium congolense]